MTNQEAIETIEAHYPPENYSMLREALDMAIARLKEQEIVRCEDCMYYDPKWVDEECRLFNNFTTEPSWFCADGERRKYGNR